MKWTFSLTVPFGGKLAALVEQEAAASIERHGAAPDGVLFRVSMVCRLASRRYLQSNPQLPREDRGWDLDNIIKAAIDGLGPILGHRKKWEPLGKGRYREIGRRSAADAKVVEIMAKKLNSGTDADALEIDVEAIEPSKQAVS